MSDSLRGLRLFVAAYEERSFTGAAKRENATQSGVSQHIRKLELELGAKLFLRNTSSVVPTLAADIYYRRCVEVLRLHDQASKTVKSFSRGMVGEVRVGLMPTLTRRALGPALSRYMDLHPNSTVRVTEADSSVLTEQVKAGELDFAIVPASDGPSGLEVREFLRTPEVLVSAQSAQLKPLAPVRIRDLGPIKLIVPTLGNTRRHKLETYLASSGVQIDRMLELDAILGTLAMVSYSEWLTILPGVMLTPKDNQDRFNANPLFDPPLHLDLLFIKAVRSSMSDEAEAFYDVLKQETGIINAIWKS